MAEIAGLKLIVPSSVAGSGVSVSASGKVTFTAATSVSVNGCFSSTYDNYLVVMRLTASAADYLAFRMRSSGSDATATNYTIQGLRANGTTVDADGGRFTSQTYGFAGAAYNTQRAGSHFYIYGPFLSQPTAARAVTVTDSSSAMILDKASTHSLSTSYDGITFLREGATANFTGSLCVYGLSQ